MRLLATFLSSIFIGSLAMAYQPTLSSPSHVLPKEFEGVGIKENLGAQLDLSIEVIGDDGTVAPLSRFVSADKPTIFTIVYYECPSLCNLHLNGLTDVMGKIKWTTGDQYNLVALSMNHKETPVVAAAKKANYLKAYGRAGGETGWQFLTASEENVRKIADAIGFRFKWVEEDQQFSHASAAVFLTPGGKISRYLFGVAFEPQTVRMALLEAGAGKVGSLVEQLILFCFQFDPNKSKYTLYAYNVMRLGGVVTVMLLALFLVPVWLRERQRGSMA
jgi:protein SCO1/2